MPGVLCGYLPIECPESGYFPECTFSQINYLKSHNRRALPPNCSSPRAVPLTYPGCSCLLQFTMLHPWMGCEVYEEVDIG